MWRWTALVLCGCGRIAFDPLAADGCIAGYEDVQGHCYRVVENMPATENDWIGAERACEADGDGAHLLVLDDEAERLIFETQIIVNDSHVGISDRVTEGVFLSVTRQPPYLPWGTPPAAMQDCVEIRFDGFIYGRECVTQEDYICEHDGIPADPSAYE